jgi:hypothetical protein
MDGNPENTTEYVLTGIHSKYTVSANSETLSREADIVVINNFINNLAEVALTIASRESDSNEVDQ